MPDKTAEQPPIWLNTSDVDLSRSKYVSIGSSRRRPRVTTTLTADAGRPRIWTRLTQPHILTIGRAAISVRSVTEPRRRPHDPPNISRRHARGRWPDTVLRRVSCQRHPDLQGGLCLPLCLLLDDSPHDRDRLQ